MSDKVSLYQAVKDNWAQVTVVFVVLAFLDLVAIDWRVKARLAETDIGTDQKIVSMDAASADNKRTGEENAEDIAENKQAVRDAFKILMGPDD